MSKILSIIVPVYNVETFVGHCIRSILDTTTDSSYFEVIIVNDGTRDDSMSVVRKVCVKHKNIVILEQENQGLSMARMNGLNVAQGEYVWFVDSDDWLDFNAVGIVLSHIKQIKPDVLITPLFWRFNDSNRDYSDITIIENLKCSGKEYLNAPDLPIWAAQRFVLKRNLFENCPCLFFPRHLYHEDEYFGRVLLYIAQDVYVLKDPIYNYRQRSNSIMSTISMQNAYDLVEIYKLLVRFLSTIQSDDRLWFHNNIFKKVLCASYYRCSLFFGGEDFNRFLHTYRKYIITEYFRTMPINSIKKTAGDLIFFLFPNYYTKVKALRHIQ